MSTRWQDPLWVGVFPANADGSEATGRYIDSLSGQQFADIETFFQHEAHRYGRQVPKPVHVVLYRPLKQLPPQLERGTGALGAAWWSLKLRWFALRAADTSGQAPPRVRLFVLFHDPATLTTVPDSHGLQKGLMGIVHAFATPGMAGSNNIVIAHELLHTLGATDKYDPQTGMPLYPSGYANPDQKPLYPQSQAEIMAGTRPLSAQQSAMSTSLEAVVVGPATAREIRWTQR